MAKSVKHKQPDVAQAPAKINCGIVMPISFCDGCDEKHWSDVKSIITQAVESRRPFSAELVSSADEVSLIHKTIVRNLYFNPIVVCDVSGKNANVMFELGLRLAFDKPTIIIKDDKTDYSFDTSVIEHIPYPRDLRYSKIVEFKDRLSKKVASTYERAQSDPDFSTFLKHLGTFVIASPETRTGTANDVVLDAISELQKTMARNVNQTRPLKQMIAYWHGLRPRKPTATIDQLTESILAELPDARQFTKLEIKNAFFEMVQEKFFAFPV